MRIRACFVIAGIVCTLLAACVPGIRHLALDGCRNVSRQLTRDAQVDAMAGSFTIAFVGTRGVARGRATRAALVLSPPSSDTLARVAVVRRIGLVPPAPLTGTLRLDADAIRAIIPGRADSVDPNRPGVVVRRWGAEEAGHSVTEIRLSVGGDGNRRDAITLDGASFEMRVQDVRTDGFSGSWASSVGMTTFEAAGYFCALRAPQGSAD